MRYNVSQIKFKIISSQIIFLTKTFLPHQAAASPQDHQNHPDHLYNHLELLQAPAHHHRHQNREQLQQWAPAHVCLPWWHPEEMYWGYSFMMT